MNKFIGMRWLVVAAGAAMLLVVAAACGTEIKEVEVPGETVTVIKEVIKEVEVPGKTIVVEKEVVKEVEVPGETVVVEKEVVRTVEVEKVIAGPERIVIKEVPGKKYVTDAVTGRVFSAPEYGGTVTPAQSHDRAVNGDPYVSIFAHYLVGRAVNEKLGALDWAGDRDAYSYMGGYMTPAQFQRGVLAESWEQPNNTTIIMNIRQGVQWHDKAPMNGRELTAKDIEWNFHRYLGRWEFADAGPGVFTGEMSTLPWDSIEATDNHTVTFKLTEPNPRALLLVLDWWHMFMLPPEVIEQHGDISDWKNQVGTGPYELTDRVPESYATYTKNPTYWGFDPKFPENRLPYIDTVEVTIVPDLATRLAGIRTGKLDYMDALTDINQALSLQRTTRDIQLWPGYERSDHAAHMNLTKPPFNDIRVRYALQLALDLETMNDTYFKGTADWTPRGLVGRSNKGYMIPYEEWSDELKGYFAYDPARAEALLDEAGYPRGDDNIRIKTKYMHRDSMSLTWTEFMVSYWADIGIDVTIETPIRAEYSAREKAEDYALKSASSGMEGDPMWNIGVFYSEGPHGSSVYDDQYDAWYEEATAATTLAEQMALITKMDKRMVDNFWYIWGPMASKFTVTWPWLQGYDGEGRLGGGTLHHLWQYLWIDTSMKKAMGY